MSHYWDCRLKGRPPGTAKSEDPNKKKRKRQARERDQCDVKIKITEYFPGARASMAANQAPNTPGNRTGSGSGPPSQDQAIGDPMSLMGLADGESTDAVPGANGERFYTIQRVNGNGANGKTDSVTGGHRHTIDDSDRIKKNSIYRHFLKEEKERRKSTVSKKSFLHKALAPSPRSSFWIKAPSMQVFLYFRRLAAFVHPDPHIVIIPRTFVFGLPTTPNPRRASQPAQNEH